MSTPSTDAPDTARRLLVQLLRAQNQHASSPSPPSPPASERRNPFVAESDARDDVRPANPFTTLEALSNPHDALQGSSHDAHFPTETNTAAASAQPDTTAAMMDTKKTSLTRSSDIVERSERKCSERHGVKAWWQRQRSRLPRPFRSTSSASKGQRRSSLFSSTSAQKHATTNGELQDILNEDVKRWRASVDEVMRYQSNKVANVLTSMVQADVQQAFASALAAVEGTSRSKAVDSEHEAGQATNAANKELPSTSCGASGDKEATSLDKCSAALRGDITAITTAAADTAAAAPANNVCTTEVIAYFQAADWATSVRVVSSGYAATISASGSGLKNTLAEANASDAVKSGTESATSARNASHALDKKQKKLSLKHRLFATKSRPTAPLTFQEQLNSCFITPPTRYSSTLPNATQITTFSFENVVRLLARVHGEQQASPSTPEHTTAQTEVLLPYAKKDNDYEDLARCTVWEYASLSPNPPAHQATDVHVERLETLADAKKNDPHTQQDAGSSTRVASSSADKSSNAAMARNDVLETQLADPLRATSDSTWSTLEANRRRTQKLLLSLFELDQKTGDPESPSDAVSAGPLLLFAWCPPTPSKAPPSAANAVHTSSLERIVVCYSRAALNLDRVCWEKTHEECDAASPADPSLTLHSTWVLCVEVEALHAACVRSALLNAAVIVPQSPSSSERAAGGDVKAALSSALRMEIIATLDKLQRLA